ncbi:sigma-54-dependent transcriptional regulator [Singulisphaera sp. PoT]|uniref:sigma-54-dependent transcriptional regulator n=1 Tax=Singulisphaera sp. PoT TaxID=3411797 RepID=UPI003BF49A18
MSTQVFSILIVDDEPNIRAGLAQALQNESYAITTARGGDEAWTLFNQGHHQLVLTDLKMPGSLSGIDLIRKIKDERPETLIIVITAHGTVETAVEAMRLGAHDYLTKPIDLGTLRIQVRNAFEHYHLLKENRRLRERLAGVGEVPEMIGRSSAIHDVFVRIHQVADTDVTILIQGESGTGKELVARAIHNLSHRREGPFIAANFGALPEGLIESELFGYEKGAFTGAQRDKAGWFEMARGGTLLLDEVGEMMSKTQVDLLRVLEQREVRRLGGATLIPLDVRLVVATHRDLEGMVASGKMREDLYYRLNVVPVRVPPLRERQDDIPLLVHHFIQWAQERHNRGAKQIASAALRAMCEYTWPGNVRQLKNCMERLVVTVEGPIIHLEDLPTEMQRRRPVPVFNPQSDDVPEAAEIVVPTLEVAVAEAEKTTILAALERCDNHRERTAQLLGISVRTLHYKMNRHNLQ